MIILSIETSCDDTSVAILEARGRKGPCFNILANIVSSQTEIHAPFGGVVPNLAARAHQRNLPVVLEKAFNKIRNPKSKIQNKSKTQNSKSKIDLVTVTVGPGLEPSLWAGVGFAKSLALVSRISVVGVNHIDGHISANFLDGKNMKFPAICLVVSGGHTQLILMIGHGKYRLLGETRDDAAGEAFDKVAKLLGLGYPGGPVVAAEAAKFLISNFKFLNKSEIPPYGWSPEGRQNLKSKILLPRPMINSKDYDFSFSGLKTAVLYKIREFPKSYILNPKFLNCICVEFQQAVIDVLIKKTLRAAKEYSVKSILCGGGVMANKELRAQLKTAAQNELPNVVLCVPPIKLCTDNAVMTGIAGYYKFLRDGADKPKRIKADGNLRI